ncbi:MAG: DegT/DnrJ/EryC1/StrS family aminotransferase [Elusimicrobiota bacterium]
MSSKSRLFLIDLRSFSALSFQSSTRWLLFFPDYIFGSYYVQTQEIGFIPLPLHLQPAFKFLGYKKGDFPVSERLSETVLSLPIFPEMTEEQQEFVIQKIREFYK